MDISKVVDDLAASGLGDQLRALELAVPEGVRRQIDESTQILDQMSEGATSDLQRLADQLSGATLEHVSEQQRLMADLFPDGIRRELERSLGLAEQNFGAVAESVRGIVEDLPSRETLRQLESLQASLGPSQELLATLQQMASTLEGAVFSLKLNLPSPEEMARGQRQAILDARALARAGWTLPLELSPAEAHVLAKLYRRKGQAAVDRWFVHHYDNGRRHEFKRLAGDLRKRPNLKPWLDVLDECLWSYGRGKYRLVIPTAFVVFEGVVVDVVKALPANKPLRFNTWSSRVPRASADFLEAAFWYSADTFLKGLFLRAPFERRTRPGAGLRRPGINRHHTLHGRAPRLGSRADALRLLVAIDFFSYLREDQSCDGNDGNGA